MTINPTFSLTGALPQQADYNTITTGSVISIFYPFDAIDNNGVTYGVTDDTSLISMKGSTTESVSMPQTTPTNTFNLPFDILFNVTRTINGNVIIEGQYTHTGNDPEVYLVLELESYDGTTATAIASAQTETNTATNPEDTRFIVSIPVSNVKIAAGNYLRVNVAYWIGSDPSGSVSLTVAHNPNNGNIISGTPFLTLTTSQLKVSVPFKVF